MIGIGDSLFFSNLINAESVGNFLNYTAPLDTYGTKLSIEFSVFDMHLGRELRSYDISGRTVAFTPSIIKELYLSEVFQVNGSIGIEMNTTDRKNVNTFTTKDRLRSPFIAADFAERDGMGDTSWSPRLTFGTSSFLGASHKSNELASREGSGGEFLKYEQSLRRIQRMPFDSYAVMRSQFQTTNHTLTSTEQIQLGGANSVRGYPEGDYLADIGGTLNVDWIFPCPFIPKSCTAGRTNTELRRQIEPAIFMDLGGGKILKTDLGEKPHRFLMGLGAGVRIHLFNKATIKLEWAERIGDRMVPGSGPSSFYFTLQSEV